MHEKNARTLALLIRLCDDLAWGRPADEDALFALTREGSSSPELERLAEAFGMMIVKVEAREFHRAELLEKVEQLSQELEKAVCACTRRTGRWWRPCKRSTTSAASSVAARPCARWWPRPWPSPGGPSTL